MVLDSILSQMEVHLSAFNIMYHVVSERYNAFLYVNGVAEFGRIS